MRHDDQHRPSEEATPAPPPDQRAPVQTPADAWPSPVQEASLGRLVTRFVPALRAFRYRDYRVLWFSSVLSSTGSWMQNAAYGVLILGITGSPLLTALIPASQQVLMGPLSPFGGLLADRYNRRNLLVVTQTAFAVSAAAIALLVLTGRGTPVAFLSISLATGVFMALNFPTYQAFFPRLVPGEELQNAVALNSVSFNVARIVGPSIGAVILRTWGPGHVFLVNAATFVLFASALFLIPSGSGRISRADREQLGSIGDGWRYVRRNRTAGTLIAGIGLISVFALPVMYLSPLMAERVFGDPQDTGFILSALGAGAIVGALVAGSLDAERRPHVGTVSYFLLAASLGAFAYVRTPVLSLVCAATFGGAYMGAAVVINSLVQLVTPDRIRGRVMSVYMMAWVGLLPVGALAAGTVAQSVGRESGAPVALGMGAGVCLLFAVRLAVRRDWIPRRFDEVGAAAPVAE